MSFISFLHVPFNSNIDINGGCSLLHLYTVTCCHRGAFETDAVGRLIPCYAASATGAKVRTAGRVVRHRVRTGKGQKPGGREERDWGQAGADTKMMVDLTNWQQRTQGDLCQCLGLSHHITVIRGPKLGLGSLGEMAVVQGGGVRVSDVDFDRVPVRMYEPPHAGGGEGGLRRAVMFYHGGGWALGDTKMGSYDVLCRQMSDELNAVVVSVEYRLAPEVHFPVQYEDCLAAAKHFLEPGILGKLSVDPQRVAVSGDSAGGNLAD